MDITACNDNGRAFATLAKIDFADNNYDPDEDVPFISSGVETMGLRFTSFSLGFFPQTPQRVHPLQPAASWH